MSKPIGEMFAKELQEAGLGGLPIAWSSEGKIEYGDTITPEQRAAVEAVLAAHDATAVLPEPTQDERFESRLQDDPVMTCVIKEMAERLEVDESTLKEAIKTKHQAM